MNTLYLDFSEPAGAEVSAAIEYIRASGGDAERFTERVAQVLEDAAARLTEEVAANENGKPWQRAHEGASIHYSQPVYRLDIETATKRRRGNAAGLWFAYYSLRDSGDMGKPDTMYVHAFRHSAGRPIGDDGDTSE